MRGSLPKAYKAYKEEFTSDQAFSAFWNSEKGKQMILTGEYRAGYFRGEVPKELAADKIGKVGVYGDTSVKLEWESEGVGKITVGIWVNYSHSPEFSETPAVQVFSEGWFSDPIDIDSPEFQEKFQSSLAEAFEHSRCFTRPLIWGQAEDIIAG